MAKTTFSAAGDPGFAALLPAGSGEIVVAGCEAHVCVLQTVLDLLAAGRRVVWAADATGSRDPADRAAAIDRARQHGAEIVTSEMVLFEWLRDATAPEVPRGAQAAQVTRPGPGRGAAVSWTSRRTRASGGHAEWPRRVTA